MSAPELTPDELAKVQAFGLDKPETDPIGPV